ncbi:MAG: hypothetical protein RSA59_05915 [Raoultibacter sp.]
MDDFYFDEIGEVVKAWNALHDPDGDGGADAVQEVSPLDFFGDGGEYL